jgi:hypothetical protein
LGADIIAVVKGQFVTVVVKTRRERVRTSKRSSEESGGHSREILLLEAVIEYY